MRTQEQAFRAYYASMSDSELLAVGQNRISYIPLAQKLVAEEFQRRNLTPPADVPAEVKSSPKLFPRIRRILGRRNVGSPG